MEGIIYKIEYDPNRNTYIGLILYKNGLISYILSYNGIKIGDKIVNFLNVDKKIHKYLIGNSYLLKDIPVGSIIYNVELLVGDGGKISRSSGSYCILVNKYIYDKKSILVRFKSKEEYLLYYLNRGCIGSVLDVKYKKLFKAGQKRWLGIRPSVRGVAMNPIDHPHGGGEGKSSGGRPSVTPYGVITKGKITRRKKKFSDFIVRSRHFLKKKKK